MRISGVVTVIVPVRDGALTVRNTLESIAAQRYRPFEIVVVDDGSTDSTPGWVRTFRTSHPEIPTHVVTLDGRGQGAALAAGLEAARGEFVAFAEAGDAWHPDKLARHVAQLQADARLVASAGETAYEAHGATQSLKAPRKLMFEHLPLSAVVVRRSALEAAGGFDGREGLAPLHDACFRLNKRGGMARLHHPVATCHRKERPGLPTAQLAATFEKLGAEGHFDAKAVRLAKSRLYAQAGWQALVADEPERARSAFETAMSAYPWAPVLWFGITCARLDQWLFTTGLLKPEPTGRLAHAKR